MSLFLHLLHHMPLYVGHKYDGHTLCSLAKTLILNLQKLKLLFPLNFSILEVITILSCKNLDHQHGQRSTKVTLILVCCA